MSTFNYAVDPDTEVEIPTQLDEHEISLHESECVQVQEPGGESLVFLNPEAYDYHTHYPRRGDGLYALWFGAVGTTRLLLWASGYEEALEECAEWLKKHAPGHFTEFDDNDREAARKEYAKEQGITLAEAEEDEEHAGNVEERMIVDMTYTESGWIPSWEWGDVYSPEGHQAPEALVKVCTEIGKIVSPPDE